MTKVLQQEPTPAEGLGRAFWEVCRARAESYRAEGHRAAKELAEAGEWTQAMDAGRSVTRWRRVAEFCAARLQLDARRA